MGAWASWIPMPRVERGDEKSGKIAGVIEFYETKRNEDRIAVETRKQ